MANCTFSHLGSGLDKSDATMDGYPYPESDVWCTDVKRRMGCWGTLGGPQVEARRITTYATYAWDAGRKKSSHAHRASHGM